jgi:hypothetical protein
MIFVRLTIISSLPRPRAAYGTHRVFDGFNVLAHLPKNCLMVFMCRHLLWRSNSTARRVAYTRAILLFDPNVMSELCVEV